MRAVILAAGRGGRLEGVIGPRPKCLARVGDRTLLERQIDALQKAGLGPITVVAGYGIEQVQRTCPRTVEIVQNTRYASTNSLYSLWLARHLLLDGFVVLNCDVLFHPQLLDDLLNGAVRRCAAGGAARATRRYGDEEMKVRIRRRAACPQSPKTLPERTPTARTSASPSLARRRAGSRSRR